MAGEEVLGVAVGEEVGAVVEVVEQPGRLEVGGLPLVEVEGPWARP